jgi:acetylglutamate kinase
MEPLYVIKIGGNIIDDEIKLKQLLQLFANITEKKILIHGGGKLATQLAAKLNIPQQTVDGRRITDASTLNIVVMVYAGYINKNIVAQLQGIHCNAIGLCGADGNVITASRREKQNAIDYGFVGNIKKVNTSLLCTFINQNMVPVMAPVTHNGKGQLLNTNADTMAQEIAQAMSSFFEVHLIYLFEKAGVLYNMHDEQSVIPTITANLYKKLKEEKTIHSGMIPKIDNAFEALKKGVHHIVIGKAESLNAILQHQSGTTISF